MGHRAPWQWATLWLLDRNFEWIESFLEHFEAGYKPDEEWIKKQANKAGPNADEYLESLAEDLFKLGGSRRIAHAAILLRSASIVEVTIRSHHERILHAAVSQGSLTTRRHKEWRGRLSRSGLEAMVADISTFENRDAFRIVAKNLPGWGRVNDTRLLCNCFKHEGGEFWYGGDRSLSKSNARILEIFGISNTSSNAVYMYHVPYEDLPIQDYVDSAKCYCKELTEAIATLLNGTAIRL